jgi:hypothetical protein
MRVAAFLACVVLLSSNIASAATVRGRCLLEVRGKTYLDGICNIDRSEDGSFSIGTGDGRASKFFAYVNKNDDGTADGYWNGIHAYSHADDNLGTLKQQGACWVNAAARVCAGR